jgi:hypothetical protein
MPRARFTHSSHSLKAKRAPSAMSAIAAPTIKAFQVAATSPVKPSAQGASAQANAKHGVHEVNGIFSGFACPKAVKHILSPWAPEGAPWTSPIPLRGCRHHEFGWGLVPVKGSAMGTMHARRTYPTCNGQHESFRTQGIVRTAMEAVG